MDATAQSLTATLDTFEAIVLEGSNRVPVLVDFWAPWCGPCRSLAPVLERIAREYAGRLLLAKVNVDEEQELAAQFGVRSIPTVLLVQHGKIVEQFTGVQPDAAIRSLVDRHVAPAGPDPGGAADPILQAHALARASDHAGAVQVIETALAERPEEPALLAVLAGLQLLARDAAGAGASIARISARDPQFPSLGTLKTRLQFLETALASPDVATARAVARR